MSAADPMSAADHRPAALLAARPVAGRPAHLPRSVAIRGIRWIGELGDEDLDPKLLLWDMRRHVDHEMVPTGRSVVEFSFSDVPARIRRVQVWRGDVTWAQALRGGSLGIQGAQALSRALPRWFTFSTFASVPRPVAYEVTTADLGATRHGRSSKIDQVSSGRSVVNA
jgi:hypothetical protein